MLKEERQQQILDLLHENGKVAVDELTEPFHVSKDTIRGGFDCFGGRGSY